MRPVQLRYPGASGRERGRPTARRICDRSERSFSLRKGLRRPAEGDQRGWAWTGAALAGGSAAGGGAAFEVATATRIRKIPSPTAQAATRSGRGPAAIGRVRRDLGAGGRAALDTGRVVVGVFDTSVSFVRLRG